MDGFEANAGVIISCSYKQTRCVGSRIYLRPGRFDRQITSWTNPDIIGRDKILKSSYKKN